MFPSASDAVWAQSFKNSPCPSFSPWPCPQERPSLPLSSLSLLPSLLVISPALSLLLVPRVVPCGLEQDLDVQCWVFIGRTPAPPGLPVSSFLSVVSHLYASPSPLYPGVQHQLGSPPASSGWVWSVKSLVVEAGGGEVRHRPVDLSPSLPREVTTLGQLSLSISQRSLPSQGS